MTDLYTRIAKAAGTDRTTAKKVIHALGYSGPPETPRITAAVYLGAEAQRLKALAEFHTDQIDNLTMCGIANELHQMAISLMEPIDRNALTRVVLHAACSDDPNAISDAVIEYMQRNHGF